MTHIARDRLASALVERYDLVREIGRGGMASVYLAADRKHHRHVAIKVLRPELAATVGADRFVREIRLVARLQHPHILPLYDSGEAEGVVYFVMPYVEGESLRDRLARDGAVTLEECAHLTRQVADALDYAHARGVVHRDVKPENILITARHALLADFGVALVTAGGGAGGTLTGAGVTLGTPAYMSPEQACAEPGLDARSDVYSLGCVCFEMLCGVPPFRAESAMGLIGQHLLARPPSLTGPRGPLPERANAAVARALAKEPHDRFPAAGAFAAALEQAMVEASTPSAADRRLRAVERRQEARQTVLVLDFANVTAAADAEWLCTGIAETVATDLNRIEALKAVGQGADARHRVATARDGRTLPDDVALELGRAAGARWVVWGSFQKVGVRIRITPRFGDVREGTATAGERVDGVMDDVFELQDRVVTGLVEVLRIRLSSEEVTQIRRPETSHLSAYEHYARGFREYLAFGRESMRAAAEHFRAAVSIDPEYAVAHAGLGLVHGPMYIATGDRTVLDEGARALERALALDPTLGDAYAWLAYMQFRQERFDESEQTARRGIEREPSSYWCWYMLGAGRLAAALTRPRPEALAGCVAPLLRVLAIHPEYHAAYTCLAAAYLLRGEYGRATALTERAVVLETSGVGLQFVGAFTQRALLHLGAGEPGLARPVLQTAVERYAGADHVYADVACAHAHWALGCVAERTGALDEARAAFGRACEVAEATPHRISIGAHWVKGRFGLARVLHRLGERAAAARWLAEGAELFANRSRFVWSWFHGASDAEMLYEQAAALATMARTAEALVVLRRAADAGWSDETWLRHDPAFHPLRDTPEVQRICRAAAARVSLPPPIGSGGLG